VKLVVVMMVWRAEGIGYYPDPAHRQARRQSVV
jgi:hypothetical protein